MKNKFAIFLIGLFCVVIVCCAILFWIVYPLKYKNHIKRYSNMYNVSSSLVASVICVESRYKTDVTSRSGACGLMQIMPTTFAWICEQLNYKYAQGDIYKPEANIEAGSFYLSYLLNKYQNQVYALACYNAGEGVVALWGTASTFTMDKIKYSETQTYVNKVQKLMHIYKYRFD